MAGPATTFKVESTLDAVTVPVDITFTPGNDTSPDIWSATLECHKDVEALLNVTCRFYEDKLGKPSVWILNDNDSPLRTFLGKMDFEYFMGNRGVLVMSTSRPSFRELSSVLCDLMNLLALGKAKLSLFGALRCIGSDC
jgi:hypothetical protein